MLESTIELLETDNDFKPETISKLLHNNVKELQMKFKTYMHLLRYSISGTKVSIPFINNGDIFIWNI